jgi:hypothetical protein
MISYRTTGLSPAPFAHLFGLDDDALANHGAKRYVVDAKPGFPDRIELRDLEEGEQALLLNYVHQAADTPYRASHAIFVREGASDPYDRVNEVPEIMRVRLLSVRAFDAGGMMLDADVVDGKDLEGLVARMLAGADVAELHVHTAKRGCFLGRINRA